VGNASTDEPSDERAYEDDRERKPSLNEDHDETGDSANDRSDNRGTSPARLSLTH
jgi:hypothetical protein